MEAANHKATLAEAEALLPVAPPAADILRWPRPAPTLPDYREVPDCLPEKHCRLCLQPVESSAWPQGLISHLSEHHGLGLGEYRATVLRDAMCGLRPTPPQLLRTRVGAYQTLASGPRVAHGVCASCARTKPTSKLTEVVLGVCEQVQGWLQWLQADWQQHCTAWLEKLDDLFNINTYWVTYFHGPERVAAAAEDYDAACVDGDDCEKDRARRWLRRVRAWSDNILQALREDAVMAPTPLDGKWFTRLLAISVCSVLGVRGALPAGCAAAVARACANETQPASRPRSWACARTLRGCGLALSPKQFASSAGLGVGSCSWVGQSCAFGMCRQELAQKGSEISRALGLLPLDLCCDIAVQYPGSHIPNALHDPALRVCLRDLRAALWWYCSNNWEWMLATRDDLPLDEDHLGARLEHLLHAYYQDGVPSADTSVPGSLVRSATTTGQQADTDEAASADQRIPDADAAGAAFLDSGVDDATPLGLWTAAMKKYDVLLQCENHLAQSEKRSTERQEAQHARMRALGEAVQALQRLSSAEVFQQLRDFETRRQEHTLVLDLGRTDKLLDNNDPSFWLHCFCDLFYRADCWEKRQGPAKLHGRRWARALLKRADFSGWVLSKEFAATAANVFMRRDQMAAVHTWLRAEHGFARIRDTLSSLSVQDFVAAATSQAGDFRSLAQALQCKPARGAKLHQIFREMMVVLRDIEGSEEHRAGAIYKMRSLRVWAGCSFLFFTLNPLDHQNPLFVSYVNSQTTLLERINLCGTDTEMEGVTSGAPS